MSRNGFVGGRRKVAAAAGAGVALAATSLGLVGAGAGAASASQSHAAQSSSGIVKFAETPGGSPNYIFPVTTSPQQSGYNINQFINLMYEPLFLPDPTQPTEDWANSIGEQPVWSDGDTVATVTLRHYQWSDGTPVTARDIIFYINMAKAEGTTYGSYAGPTQFPYNLKSVTAVNPYEVKFVLKTAFNPLYYDLDGIGYITPLPQQAWDKESANGPIGNYDETASGAAKVLAFLQKQAAITSTYATNPLWKTVDGAFELKSFGGSSSDDVLVPNPSYSGHKATISELEEIPFTSDAAEFTSLKAGPNTLNYGGVPSEDIPEIPSVESEGYAVTPVHIWQFDYIIPNEKNPQVGAVLSQTYMRQVLAYLTDQNTMIKDFMHGDGIPTYGIVPAYPQGNQFLSSGESKNPYPYSIAKAESLLKAHDWTVTPNGTDVCNLGGAKGCGLGVATDQQLALNLIYANGSTVLDESTDLFVSDAAQAGVKINATSEDFNTIIAQVQPCTPKDVGTATCNWQLGEYGGLGQATFPTGDGVLNTGGSFNSGQYSNPTLDKLIQQSTTAPTLAPFKQMENIIVSEEPWIWQPLPDAHVAVVKGLTGYGITSEFTSGANGFIEPQFWTFSK